MVSKYFGRPRMPWTFIYFFGGALMVSALFPLVVVSLGSFRLGAVIETWADFCFRKGDEQERRS